MSSFLKIKCSACGNEQVVFSKATSKVKCLACDKELAKTTGGKIKALTKNVKELE